MFMDEWQPELCLMATFGQKIPNALINYPSLGFYNFHHSGDTWPSYPGPDPIAAMVRDGRKHLVLTIHKVTDVIDGGEFVARSHRVAIPEGINCHWDAPHHLAADETVHPPRRLARCSTPPTRCRRLRRSVLQEQAVPFRTANRWDWADRIAA